MTEAVSVSREIAVPADELWEMVTDVARMGEWSPENEGGEWTGGATGPEVGARFRSRNRVGNRSWKTTATVIETDPARRFAFRVAAGPVPVSEWSYTFDPTASGCVVTESWTDRRPGWFRPVARLVTGVADRVTHNRAGMEQTLARLAEVAESGASPS